MANLFLYDKIRGSEEEKHLFKNKLIKYANLLNTNADWIMIVMWFESRLNPSAVNNLTGATGLIQFMPQTANYLGTSVDELKRMTGSEQLDYVYKYLKNYNGKLGTLTDIYLTVFYPYAVGKSKDYVLGSHLSEIIVERIAQQNKIFDTNGDNKISKSEVENYFTEFARKTGYKSDVQETPQKKKYFC